MSNRRIHLFHWNANEADDLASGEQSDPTQVAVREIGLAARLVGYKVCSINRIWSGLRFTRRKQSA